MRLKDKVTLVTGAGAGIGKAIAVKFAAEGAKLVINDINSETGQGVVDEIKATGGAAAFIQGDTSNSSDVDSMMKFTTDTYGRLDVLVNNAGVEELAPFHVLTREQWDRVISINLTGVFLVAQGAVNQMLTQGGGTIVNIASLGGLIGFPMFSAYCASKHAVVGLTKTMALELREQKIRVNAVCPAFVQTSMVDRAVEFFENAGVPIHDMLAQFQGHVGTVEEVANLAAYLAGEESTFINGAAIPIDNAAHAN
jgi:NAD(P)-dependent dehydrogenase (short-subunit alcohol dehydrogenase family)